jgi:hypothetical protein
VILRALTALLLSGLVVGTAVDGLAASSPRTVMKTAYNVISHRREARADQPSEEVAR